MDYIVFDLEWNQSDDPGDVRSRHLPFEIIEIGAVKLNSRMEIVDTFQELIRPRVYHRMHRVTERLIQIHMEDLRGCRNFSAVVKDFLRWCGEDYLFVTWGTQDLTELQKNLRYFGAKPLSGGPLRYYDLQKLFALAFEEGKTQRSLEFAVDYLNLPKDNQFHRALADAHYTALVLQQIKNPVVLSRYSFDTYSIPKTHFDEVHVVFDTYAKYISRGFESKEELLADKEVISTKCYLCHHNLRRKIRWFTPNGKHYYSVSYCDKHGYMKGKIRVRKSENDLLYAVKTTKFISEEDMNRIVEKRDHARELRKEKKKKEKEARKTQSE